MSLQPLIFDSVTFTYPGSIEPVFIDLTAHFSHGWTGIVGANGSGKTTVLHLAAGLLTPDHGTITGIHNTVLCPQRTDSPPDMFTMFLSADDANACKLRGQLGISDDWESRWQTLSHGERKRAQIATALWRRPLLIAADEPTNHIDSDTRAMLIQALHDFSGIGILVSHDRTLLDTLCSQCLFLDEQPVMRPGGYWQGIAEYERERITQRREYSNAHTAVRKLKREMHARRSEASRADKKRSKRGLSPKDHDGRFKKNIARITGKDATAGKLLRQLAGRFSQAKESLNNTSVPKKQTLGIRFTGAYARKDFLVRLPEGELTLGEHKTLHYPQLTVRPDDTIGITGANGNGKSTLVTHITAHLTIPPDRLVYIPQEITEDNSRQIVNDIRRLSGNKLGHVMELVSHLNSEPERLLQTDLPSPGELRKLMLALGIIREPYLIIMDEPTNHLDLPSIRCLEEALSNVSCGLLLVSHDQVFLEKVTTITWNIVPAHTENSLILTIT